MKLTREDAERFGLSTARRRGYRFWAKAVGSPSMRFSRTEGGAERYARRDAAEIARNAGCPQYPPSVQSGEI